MPFSSPEQNIKYLSLEKGMHVGDLGAGSGFYTLAVAKEMAGSGKVYAIDIQKDLLDRLKNEARKQGLLNVEVIWGDIETVGGSKLKDSSLDAVIASNILFQISQKEHFANTVEVYFSFGQNCMEINTI